MKPARLATAVVLATTGGLLTAVAAPASAATTCTSPVYKRQFYANTTFSGTPKKTDCDSTISESWGAKAPASGLPTNNFGVRWSVTRDFGSGGPFAFAVAAQDGIRVYLDGVRKVDVWKNVSSTVSKTVNLTVPKGRHTLRVDYVNWTGNANAKFTYTPRTTASVDTVKPLAPTGAAWDNITDIESEWTTYLTWSKNQEMDLAGYRVYRRVQGAGTWTKVGTTTGLGFSDTPPPTGQSYYYEIRAYDKAGNESAGGADQGPSPTNDTTGPTAPVLTARAVEDSNDLSWTASAADAVEYRVFRKSAGATSYTQLAETTATSWTDTEATGAAYGKAYDYKVSALDAAGNATASNVVRSTRTITPPQNVTATLPSWGAVFTLTEPAGGDTVDYRVYRSPASGDGSRTWELTTCRSRTSRTEADGSTVRSCTDYDGRQGVTYIYVMTRKNTAGRWSTASAELTVTRPGDEIPPPPVTGLTAEPLEYGVKLDWDDSTAEDLAAYQVYEQTEWWRDPEYIATVPAGTSEYVVAPEAADGESTHYIVVASDIYGNSRTSKDDPDIDDWSQEVSKVAVTELDLTPTVIPENTAPCSVSAWTVTGSAGGMYIECAGSVATEAAGINVYRWDRATSTYVRLTDVPLAPTATSYIDTTAPTGTTHHYVLSVVAADGSETFSNVDHSVFLPSGA